MEKEKTPTHKFLGRKFIELGMALDEELLGPNASNLSFDRMHEIVEVISMLMGEDPDRFIVVNEMKAGLFSLEKTEKMDATTHKQVLIGARQLLVGVFKLAIAIAGDRVKSEVLRISPLARQNQAKEDIINRACELATELWGMDKTQSVRIGVMADMVYRKLVGEGMRELLPDSEERIKDWIKSVAPSYARKGGRARKPPARIG